MGAPQQPVYHNNCAAAKNVLRQYESATAALNEIFRPAESHALRYSPLKNFYVTGNPTNLYLLGLAHSAAGKDWLRKLNTRILHDIGMPDCLGVRFASGEGVQDALFLSPSMLFQTDEIDGILQSINISRHW